MTINFPKRLHKKSKKKSLKSVENRKIPTIYRWQKIYHGIESKAGISEVFAHFTHFAHFLFSKENEELFDTVIKLTHNKKSFFYPSLPLSSGG